MKPNLLDQLLEIVRTLRNPEKGCPWDIQQTHRSLIPYLREESWELEDELVRQDSPEKIKDELGDLLFQVLIHSEIASEKGGFDFNDVMEALSQKLLRRHPHVFDEKFKKTYDGDLSSLWQRMKKQEGRREKHPLDKFPLSMPALLETGEISRYAAEKNFDWPEIQGVLDKIDEETAELKEALLSKKPSQVEEEVGDLLFTICNLCRHLNLSPDATLKKSNTKFKKRFQELERELSQRKIKSQDPELLNELWELAKKTTG